MTRLVGKVQDPLYTGYKKHIFKYKNTIRQNEWKRYTTLTLIKRAEMAILISDKVDFKVMNVTRDNEDHFKMIKKPTSQR